MSGIKWKQFRMPDTGSLVHRWVRVDCKGNEIGDNSVAAIRRKINRSRARTPGKSLLAK